jgi:hypothetical protein
MSETTHEHGMVTTNEVRTQVRVSTKIERGPNRAPEGTGMLLIEGPDSTLLLRLDLCRLKVLRSKLDLAIEAIEGEGPGKSRKR